MSDYHRGIEGTRGKLPRYDELGEHDKLRHRVWAAECFAGQIDGAWSEQRRGVVEWGLSREDWSATMRWATWERYDYELATWKLDAANYEQWRIWSQSDASLRDKDSPGIAEPKVPRPNDDELPWFVQQWNRDKELRGDVMGGLYLRECRERASLPVAPMKGDMR